MTEKVSKKCSHIIRHNKYERNAPEIGSWWYKLFDIMEKEAAIVSSLKKSVSPNHIFKPLDKRQDVINEIFPSKLLNKILSILSVEENIYLPAEKVEEKTAPITEQEEYNGSLLSLINVASEDDNTSRCINKNIFQI